MSEKTIAEEFIVKWQKIVKKLDFDQLMEVLAEEVTFCSPAVHKPYAGKEQVGEILRNVIEVMPDLDYIGLYIEEPHGVAMRFASTTEFKGKTISVEGVDFFKLNPQGKVENLTVMLRPYRGLEAVMTNMGARLAAKMSMQEKIIFMVRAKLGLKQNNNPLEK